MFEAGTFTSAVHDPENGTCKVIPTPDDMFCAGHVQLKDGRVLVMSGNKGCPSADGTIGYQGYKDPYIFDPETETYTKTNDMNDGHWYPSATILGNGDVIGFGGLREDSTGSVTADRWSDAEQQWLPTWKVYQTWNGLRQGRRTGALKRPGGCGAVPACGPAAGRDQPRTARGSP